MTLPTGTRFDARYSDPEATSTSWDEVEVMLAGAELYWLTTVRSDGRPHTTPLVGVWHEGEFAFTTGPGEQKHENLLASSAVTVTTGSNTWAAGTDVVVEGRAARATGRRRLEPLAAAFRAKYGSDWDWYAEEDGFRFGPEAGTDGSGPDGSARPWVIAVPPTKVLAFAKNPHAQTVFNW